MGKKKVSPIVIFVLAVAALYTIIYILPTLTGVLRSSYTAEYGELRISDKTVGYFVRNEYVYFSDIMGEENRYIKGNTLVRRGTRVMEVVPRSEDEKKSSKGVGTYSRFRRNIKGERHIITSDFIARQEGIVSYHIDGYESLLTPANMNDKDKNYLSLISGRDDIDLKRKDVLSTDPVFKICDRSNWYIICYVNKNSVDNYEKGKKVSIVLEGDKEITGKVEQIKTERREKRLTIRTNHYFSGFTDTRVTDMEVVSADVQGLIISNSSIVKKNGKPGVYVRDKTGKYSFKRISVIATDGKESAIEPTRFRDKNGDSIETVGSHDDVLRHPSRDM